MEIATDDAWMRDIGPTFVVDRGRAPDDPDRRRGVDWVFNAWGGTDGGLYAPWDADDRAAAAVLEAEGFDRYRAPLVLEGGSIHVDGEGTLLTTEECLLNRNRNPSLDRGQIEQHLRAHTGADTLTNKPHRRPLPEAWTEMLGHVIEETQGRAPSAQTPTAPKPAPTHKPEPQPVVRSRPTTTPGKNRMAATVSTSPTPANTQPATQSIPKRAQPLIGVAAAGFLVFVIVIFVIIALANSSSHGSSQSSRDVGSSPSTQIPTTAPTPVTTSATTPPPTPTTAPAPPTSGVSYKGLTCSSQEALWLSTAQSVVLICDQGGGTYVYNGLRLSDGASIQIPGAFRTAEGFSVTNKGWRYDVGLDGLVLQSPDGDVDRQPAVESGY